MKKHEKRMKALQDLHAKMAAQVTNFDLEVAHGSADNYLQELAKILARPGDEAGLVEGILAAYAKVGKWYA